MAFSINQFTQAALQKGGARPTLFEVQLNSPLQNGLNVLSKFHVHTAALPASNIPSFEIPYMGRKIKLAGDRVFDSWTVSIYNDEDFGIRSILENWHGAINGLETNLNTFGSSSPANYKRNATVTQYSKHGEALRTYQFIGMFPVEIQQIDLDWAQTDTIESFQTTFVYDYYELIRGGAPGGNPPAAATTLGA